MPNRSDCGRRRFGIYSLGGRGGAEIERTDGTVPSDMAKGNFMRNQSGLPKKAMTCPKCGQRLNMFNKCPDCSKVGLAGAKGKAPKGPEAAGAAEAKGSDEGNSSDEGKSQEEAKE
ncbi:MAG: hypothetical protein FWE70_01810 [Oscillospiraceae bacterium]|nr:hypothetical protein [Oscillospiraceae bacterium]